MRFVRSICPQIEARFNPTFKRRPWYVRPKGAILIVPQPANIEFRDESMEVGNCELKLPN
jgi:hypothetical protein